MYEKSEQKLINTRFSSFLDLANSATKLELTFLWIIPLPNEMPFTPFLGWLCIVNYAGRTILIVERELISLMIGAMAIGSDLMQR